MPYTTLIRWINKHKSVLMTLVDVLDTDTSKLNGDDMHTALNLKILLNRGNFSI